MSAPLEKTPITILNELCRQEGETFFHETNETNEKMFSCKVEAFGSVAIASGRSKKQAKHEACADLIGELSRFYPHFLTYFWFIAL